MNIKTMSKDELELLSNKDITNLLLTEKGCQSTPDLFNKIIKLLELPAGTFDKKIGDYYTSLTTDKRFVILDDGKWDLKSRYTSDRLIKLEEDDDDEEIDDIEEINDEEEEETDDFDRVESDESDIDDTEDDLKDLVVIDEDELELEQ